LGAQVNGELVIKLIKIAASHEFVVLSFFSEGKINMGTRINGLNSASLIGYAVQR
jgi:hypothetical protein